MALKIALRFTILTFVIGLICKYINHTLIKTKKEMKNNAMKYGDMEISTGFYTTFQLLATESYVLLIRPLQ